MGLLTIKEAAKYLALSETGLRKLVRRRAIRYSQHGRWGRIRFRPEWLEEFIEAGVVAPLSASKPLPPRPKRQVSRLPGPEKSHGLDRRLLDL